MSSKNRPPITLRMLRSSGVLPEHISLALLMIHTDISLVPYHDKEPDDCAFITIYIYDTSEATLYRYVIDALTKSIMDPGDDVEQSDILDYLLDNEQSYTLSELNDHIHSLIFREIKGPELESLIDFYNFLRGVSGYDLSQEI